MSAKNKQLGEEVFKMLKIAERFSTFNLWLSASGLELPTFLFADYRSSRIEFDQGAMQRLAEIFGKEGWTPDGAHFVKTVMGIQLYCMDARLSNAPAFEKAE